MQTNLLKNITNKFKNRSISYSDLSSRTSNHNERIPTLITLYAIKIDVPKMKNDI